MNLASLLYPPPLFVEIGPDMLRARRAADGVALALERGPDGRLTAACKDKTIAALKDFLKPKGWQPRIHAWCAITARGVSLRRVFLPGGSKEELHQRLLLQLEADFPLHPDDLAWGWHPIGEPQIRESAAARQELLVAAVKKELVADYHEILRASGADPTFTLAALARWNACGRPANSAAMLDVNGAQAELTVFENSLPVSTRIIYQDAKSLSTPSDAAIESLAQAIKSTVTGSRVLLSGIGLPADFAERLEASLRNGCRFDRIEAPPENGNSTAIAGLEEFHRQDAVPPLQMRMEPASNASTTLAAFDWKKWGARLGVLAAAVLLLPYAEALMLKPHLERKVASFKAECERLNVIDRELDFLQRVKLQQPPYIDLLYVFSKSVPMGTRFDSLSLNSHGDVSLRCAFRDGQQVAEFRDKLVASGFFTNVVVEEQVPTPDRQKVNVRISAKETTAVQMQAASAKLAVAEAAKPEKKGSVESQAASPSHSPALRNPVK